MFICKNKNVECILKARPCVPPLPPTTLPPFLSSAQILLYLPPKGSAELKDAPSEDMCVASLPLRPWSGQRQP